MSISLPVHPVVSLAPSPTHLDKLCPRPNLMVPKSVSCTPPNKADNWVLIPRYRSCNPELVSL
jgi:hypothetical protein